MIVLTVGPASLARLMRQDSDAPEVPAARAGRRDGSPSSRTDVPLDPRTQ
jgi:hypothetical protein